MFKQLFPTGDYMIGIGWSSTTGKFCTFNNCYTMVQCVNGVKAFPEAILEVHIPLGFVVLHKYNLFSVKYTHL